VAANEHRCTGLGAGADGAPNELGTTEIEGGRGFIEEQDFAVGVAEGAEGQAQVGQLTFTAGKFGKFTSRQLVQSEALLPVAKLGRRSRERAELCEGVVPSRRGVLWGVGAELRKFFRGGLPRVDPAEGQVPGGLW